MKINCSIADDLLPLYLEDACSEDSKAALEEHMKNCPACREKSARMKEPDFLPQEIKAEPGIPLAGYAKKVKRHRIRMGIFAILMSVLAACILSMLLLTVKDLHAQSEPLVHGVEAGVYNLTAGDLETTGAEVGDYILFTNNAQIKVSLQAESNAEGTFQLWNVKNEQEPILYGTITPGENTCTFTGLSAANRYRVTCSGAEQAVITVSEGREIGFWSSFKHVLREIGEMIRN